MAYDASKPANDGHLADAPAEIRANFAAIKSEVEGKAASSHSHPQSESHNTPDTDSATTAIHHTIGTGANQAAAGNHGHDQSASHGNADTDSATTSLHHTIGTGANQAAAGNHAHSAMDSHIASTSNPHGVTKAQIGLENVPNVDATNASNLSSGTIPIERIPPASLERLIVVADQAGRYALTTNEAQNGDTVKQTDTGFMYFVVDATKLGESAGYSEYTVGQASAVPWSGVTSKPTTLTGFGITDAATLAVLNNFIVTESMGGLI